VAGKTKGKGKDKNERGPRKVGRKQPEKNPNGTRRIMASGSVIKTPLNPQLEILSRGSTRRTWMVKCRLATGGGAVPLPLGGREM